MAAASAPIHRDPREVWDRGRIRSYLPRSMGVYIDKEDLIKKTQKPTKERLTRSKEKKNEQPDTDKKILKSLLKKEDPFITYINKTKDNEVMVHIEEVKVNRKSMKVLIEPEYLNDDVMDAYIQCLRDKEKGIRGDGKAFLEQAIKTGLLNIFLPTNIIETHWYLAILNAKRCEVQILDSLAKPISEHRHELGRVRLVWPIHP
uniref:Ubiquitin-like protease family profile domain-containing protein n=1 Tax=Oryza nivara TaxID=4536 RepID=A0A0E0G526_ORYNI